CIHMPDGGVNYYSDSYDDYMKGHGNSSWSYEKKSYNIFLEEADSLLGMESAREWVLLANALDETNLRNKLVLDFVSELSNDYKLAPQSEYVELFVNGEYLGLYLLCERIRNVATDFLSQNDYLFICQNDHISKVNHPYSAVQFANSLYFEIVPPSVSSDSGNDQFGNYLRRVAGVVGTDEWADYLDIDSFAKKYLIEEVFANIDGVRASQYYYWDRDNGRLYSGPCWDYDLALGYNTQIKWIAVNNLYIQNGLWYKDIFLDQDFCNYYKQLYRSDFLPLLNDLIENRIPEICRTIDKAGSNNLLRWNSSFASDIKTADDIIGFLSGHVDFLNSIWLEDEEYCKISFYYNGGGQAVTRYLLKNSSAGTIPTPEDMGFDSDHEWFVRGADRTLDRDMVITEDISLYIDNEPAPGYRHIRKYVSVLVLFTMFLFFMVLLFADYQLNYRKGRPAHE
ncbi:MAG: CotH kinase family protein, partial [Lachnospiraceae bacterium]|nr:CotH kinase family protein [Lachnospiraceae bacterium]